MSRTSRRFVRLAVPATIATMVASMVLGSPAGAAQAPVGLGTATSFSVLAGSAITNTGPTTVNGDIGSFPTPTITGLGPGADQITFTPPAVNHGGDAVTQGAKSDLQVAYDDAGSRLPNIAQDAQLGGELLTEGVYQGGATGLTGVLQLDFQGSSTAQFVFKLTELTTASNSSVVILNPGGNDACRVVWQISSSATFGTGTDFVGDVLAHTSITANTGADFNGRLLALGGAVTLDTNTINIGTCAQVMPTTTTTATVTTSATTSSTTSTTVRRTTTTTRPTATSSTSTTAAPTATTAPTTSTTLLKVIATSGGTPTPTPTTIDPSVTGQGEQTPIVPPAGSPTATGTPPGVPELPRTGTSTLVLAVSGAALVVLGSAAVRIERRARTAQLA